MSKFIDRAIAEKLVGREHGSGKLVRHEQRAGRVVMISQCSNCRAERPVSLPNAAQAVQNPTIAVIACPMVCKRVAQPPTATEVQKSEKEMTADEYRKQVVEPEFEARKLNAQRVTNAPIQAANARAAVAANGALWEQRERFLLAVAYSVGAGLVNDPRVLRHESFITFEDWKTLSPEDRQRANELVDLYFTNHGM